MKRKIFLSIILILELVVLVALFIDPVRDLIVSVWPMFGTIHSHISNAFSQFTSLIKFDWYQSLPSFIQRLLVVIVFNIAFIIVYAIVFGIIAYAIRKHKQKKLLQAGKEIHLTDEENAKYEWKLYEQRFPKRRLLSLLIPIIIFALFILLRYDTTICARYDNYHHGVFDFFGTIEPYLFGLGQYISDAIGSYIRLNNAIVAKLGVTYVEWIEIAVAFILVCLIWWGFFSIFAKPFRIHHAKKRANKAKKKYIIKMENIEYKALKKAKKEDANSKKVQDLYNQDVEAPQEEAKIENIAKTYDDKANAKLPDDGSLSQDAKDYIDDIATGIVDLGVVDEDNDELQKPLLSRQSHFVGEEEIDIKLEEEPLIETVEEEEEYYQGEDSDEISDFEHYQSDNGFSLELEDKVRKYNVDTVQDDQDVVKYQDDNVAIHEYEDVNSNKVVKEEKKEQYFTPNYVEEESFLVAMVDEKEDNDQLAEEEVNQENKEVASDEETIFTPSEAIKEEMEETAEIPSEETESVTEEDNLPQETEEVKEETIAETVENNQEEKVETTETVTETIAEEIIPEKDEEIAVEETITETVEPEEEITSSNGIIAQDVVDRDSVSLDTDGVALDLVEDKAQDNNDLYLDNIEATISEEEKNRKEAEQRALRAALERKRQEAQEKAVEEKIEKEKAGILANNLSDSSSHGKIKPLKSRDIRGAMNAYLLKAEESKPRSDEDLLLSKPLTKIREKKNIKPLNVKK